MSNSPPYLEVKTSREQFADPEGAEGPPQVMQMEAARAEIVAVDALFRAALTEQLQLQDISSSCKAFPVSRTLSQLIGTLGVTGGKSCLNWGVAKTGTSEQTRDSQLLVIISSGIATWEKVSFNSRLWQSSSNKFCHSGLRHPLYLAAHPVRWGSQEHPSYPAHAQGISLPHKGTGTLCHHVTSSIAWQPGGWQWGEWCCKMIRWQKSPWPSQELQCTLLADGGTATWCW